MTRPATRNTLLAALSAALLFAAAFPALAQDAPPAADPPAALVATAAPAVAAPGAAAEDEAVPGPSLNRALIARGVEDHLPLGTQGPFIADGEPLYVYLEVNNPGDDEVVYTVNWHHLDRDRRFSQTIEAGHSPRWRTWVYHRMSERRVGAWHVEVVAPNGEVQAALDFEVVPAPSAPAVEAPSSGSPDV